MENDMTGKTLKELNVQPGDVVEYDGSFGGDVCRQTISGWDAASDCYYHTGQKFGGAVSMNDGPCWRLISRASDTPKTWGEITDAEKGAHLVQIIVHGKQGQILSRYTGEWENHGGRSFSIRNCYRVRPEPKRETVTLYGKVKGGFWTDWRDADDTHSMTYVLLDGEPEGTAKIERLA